MNISVPLTLQDVLFAAMAAFVVMWLIKTITRVFKSVITRSTRFDFAPRNRETVLEKCCKLFPTEYLWFNDAIYRRGMQVRILTSRDILFEGQFVGVNDENMVCIMSSHQVVAQELTMIENMEIL
jgi:hypothetical protein